MKVLIATHNQGKIHEFKALLKKHQIEALTVKDFPPQSFEVEETGASYLENAVLKALKYYEVYQVPVISDDSGLEVVCLDGAPGIKSSRFLDSHVSFETKRKALIQLIGSNIPAEAFFVAYVVYYDGHTLLNARGDITGLIIHEERGTNGFGYDPIFFLPDYQKTMAEISDNLKNTISHRAKACEALIKKIPLMRSGL